jgi:hypothetical protein
LQRPIRRATIDGMTAGVQAVTAESSELPKPADTPAETPLARVLDEIRADAGRDPRRYAREAIVPEGGE